MSYYHDKMFKKGLQCKHCGKPIDDRNKTGSCAHCRMTIDQRGAGNHMFGKVMTEEERKRCADSSRKLWENPEYRKKVIENATGLHRGEDFRRGQSIRTKASYDKIDGLREQRGKLFSACWKDGRTHVHFYQNHKSPIEQSLCEEIKTLGFSIETEKKLKYGKNNIYSLTPDIIVEGRIVVEFYGDYFHGNPRMFKPTDVIGFGQTAQEKWKKDRIREKRLKEMGYGFYVVWENDLKNRREETLSALKTFLMEHLRGEAR